jgi:CubicO group peptidase (beta-lactamase class C family)
MTSTSAPTAHEALARALARIDAWEVPHASVVVVGPDGELGAHGDVDHQLYLASLAKPLTAAVVLLEVAAGRIDLDEPAGPTAAQGATVRHLLAHTAGLGFNEGERTMAPGVRRVYSNWGYEVAGALASERSGLAFPDLARELLTGPLGMDTTEFRGSPAWDAHGTARDVARFARELLAPRVLDAATHHRLTTLSFDELDGVLPGFGRQRPNGWTLGLEVRGVKDPHWSGARLSPTTVGHFGRSGSLIWADPVQRIGLASLSGREFDEWARVAWPELNDAVVDALTGGAPGAP